MEAPPTRQTVLAVSSDSDQLDTVRVHLESCGIPCRITTDPVAAVAELVRRPVDVVLVDVPLSGMDGLDLVERMERIDPEVPVVVTGLATVDTAVRFLKAQAYDFLTRPVDLDQLVEVIRRAFEKRRLAQENAALKDALVLYQISQAVAASVDECEVLALVLQSAERELAADRVALFLRDDPGGPLVRWRDEHEGSPVAEVERWVAGLAAEREEAVVAPADTGLEPLAGDVGSAVAAPLRIHEGTVGAIVAVRCLACRPFTRGNQQMLSILAGNAAAAIGNARHARETVETRAGRFEAHVATIGALVSALDAREHETQVHSLRVTEYALRLAAEFGLTPAEERDLRYGAMLHDIGKIGVADRILLKPGPLTPDEWEQMRRHPTIGYQILRDIRFLEGAARIVLYHQERFDGTGYPFGLAGNQIPIGARLFAIADTLDAMTTDRPYRAALSYDDVVLVLERERGRQFDPELVDAFLRIPLEEWQEIGSLVGEAQRGWEPILLGSGLAVLEGASIPAALAARRPSF
jgi:putative nucleotidyltransferase with HDIG domain